MRSLIFIFLLSACSASAEKTPEVKEISSYEECVAAGYPILKTYPPQCVTPDGKRFVRGK